MDTKSTYDVSAPEEFIASSLRYRAAHVWSSCADVVLLRGDKPGIVGRRCPHGDMYRVLIADLRVPEHKERAAAASQGRC